MSLGKVRRSETEIVRGEHKGQAVALDSPKQSVIATGTRRVAVTHRIEHRGRVLLGVEARA